MLYYSKKPEHKELVESFKKEFAEYKCEKPEHTCENKCGSVRNCECLCEEECPCIWLYTQEKPAKMTTKEAATSGRETGKLVRELQGYLDAKEKTPRGLKTQVKEKIEQEPFKDESVFMKFFGPDWDMIKRIAVDPAHQFYNLVKDYLALIGNYGSMKLKAKHLDAEQKHGRFKDVTLGNAPWQVSAKLKSVLTQLQGSLKIPNTWPMQLSYFTDDYEKIKIAEALAFCGDIGCYYTDLTDIQPDIKEVCVCAC